MALRRSGVRIPSAPHPLIRRRRQIVRLLALVLVALLPLGTGAQPSTRPELIVIVQPFGNVTALVCTYSSAVPHAQARARVERLAGLTGGRLEGLSIRDVEPHSAPASGRRRPSPSKQTGVECTLHDSRYTLDRAFNLQPFLTAFGDVGTFEVMFFVQRLADFRGLRAFEADGVQVRLVQDGAPYRYRFEVRPDRVAEVALPAYQPLEERPEVAVRHNDGKRSALWTVMLWGVGAGAAVFVTMVARGKCRAARAADPLLATVSEGKAPERKHQ